MTEDSGLCFVHQIQRRRITLCIAWLFVLNGLGAAWLFVFNGLGEPNFADLDGGIHPFFVVGFVAHAQQATKQSNEIHAFIACSMLYV